MAVKKVFQNHADGQTNGTAITPANSATFDDGFQHVYIRGASAAITWDTAQKAHGTGSIKFAGLSPASAAANAFVGWQPDPAADGPTTFARAYVYLTGLPTASAATLIWGYDGPSGADIGGVRVDTAGHVGVQLPNLGTSYWSTSTISLNTWYRFEWTQVVGTSGSELLKVYALDATSGAITVNPTGINTGSVIPTEIKFGKLETQAGLATFWMDDLAATTDGSYIAPYNPTVSAPPTVTASSTTSGMSVSLFSTATTFDHATPTFAWAQLSGPAVTLSNTAAANPTFTAPTAGTYVHRVTVTDSLSQTAQATVTTVVVGLTNAPAGNAVVRSNVNVIDCSGSSATAGGALTFTISPSSGVLQPLPGVFIVPQKSTDVNYTVTITEASNPNTTQLQQIVPATVTLTGIRVLRATDSQANGGVFS